jgi:hypothetical protein
VSEIYKADVLAGLEEALETIDNLRVQQGSELEEGRPELPLAQIYWLRSQTAVESGTDRNTFMGQGWPQRWLEWVFRIDVRASEAGFFGQAYGKMLTLEDEIEDTLEEAATDKPVFGVVGLGTARWTAEFVTWTGAGSTEPEAVGSRFEVVCRIG